MKLPIYIFAVRDLKNRNNLSGIIDFVDDR